VTGVVTVPLQGTRVKATPEAEGAGAPGEAGEATAAEGGAPDGATDAAAEEAVAAPSAAEEADPGGVGAPVDPLHAATRTTADMEPANVRRHPFMFPSRAWARPLTVRAFRSVHKA
jgi:hypothetical protein